MSKRGGSGKMSDTKSKGDRKIPLVEPPEKREQKKPTGSATVAAPKTASTPAPVSVTAKQPSQRNAQPKIEIPPAATKTIDQKKESPKTAPSAKPIATPPLSPPPIPNEHKKP